MSKFKDHAVSIRRHGSSHAFKTAPIAALFEDCLQYFEQLSITMEGEDTWKSSSIALDGSQSRFRQWSSDTGASDRSLDHALRKASRLQETTIDLLQELLSTLDTSKAEASFFPKTSR